MRVNLYIDYWNFQSAIRNQIAVGERILWRNLCKEAVRVARDFCPEWKGMTAGTTYLFGSRPPEDATLTEPERRNIEFLNSLHGGDMVVSITPRKWRATRVRCNTPGCHHEVVECPECHKPLVGSEEKGVDASMFTKMVGDVVDGHTDAVIIASQDADMIPVALFLRERGIPVINLGFQVGGHRLSESCSALVTLQEFLSKVRLTA